jgi:hypothetical protein
MAADRSQEPLALVALRQRALGPAELGEGGGKPRCGSLVMGCPWCHRQEAKP